MKPKADRQEKSALASERLQSRERLIRFLESPASYSHGPSEVHSIQTHISWVFIASPFVFKVKKPVNLGFLDFSTFEKRRHFCQRELELNRRLCPEIYLGVVPIYRSLSGYSFQADGEIAEYSVKMKELPSGWFLSELLAKGLVDEKAMNRVISCLHRFYESETPSPEIEEWGAPEKLKISTDENFAQVEPFVGKTISPAAFETICHFTGEFYVAKKKNYSLSELSSTGFAIATEICTWITSISLQKRRRFSIVSSSTIGCDSSTSQMISHF